MNKMLITTAGLAEIVNAEQSGTAPVVLSHVAFGTGQYTATADMTALKSEFKRFDSVAGGAIADNMIHLTVHDNSTDKYTVNEVGVFTASGTLFAVISQTTPIMEKSATSESMLAIDIALTDIDASSITFGDTNLVLNPATTAAAGIVELATDAEAKTGTDTTRAMTPATAKAARDADANIVHRTGNETIAGNKTFTGNLIVSKDSPFVLISQNDIVKGTTPSASQYMGVSFTDSEGHATTNRLGLIETKYMADGGVCLAMSAYKPEKGSTASAVIELIYPLSGNPYATAPTPDAGDNSTKIATTAWANAKFLPLAGGTMTGAIKRAGVFATGTTTDAVVSLHGGTASLDGAGIWLYGKDNTNAGKFLLRSADANGNVDLVGYPNGGLSWNGKNIVRSVNGKNADAAGNATITAADVDALPTSGGAMTATKAITRDVNNSYLGLHGGTGTDNDGAQLDLCGSEHPSMPGVFQLHARTPDKDVILRGMTDGKLTWGDKYVLTNSYVATVDNGAVMLTAGTQSVKGAYLRLYGADHSTGAGTFAIAASDGTTSKSLTGNADGTLTWNGRNVVTATQADNTVFRLYGGTAEANGPYIMLYGKDSPYNKTQGDFGITARNGDAASTLRGQTDGTLTWNGINMSAMSMPSGTYKDLTLGSSGSKYTAPADGWVYLSKTTSGSSQYVSIQGNKMSPYGFSGNSGNYATCILPVKAGDEFTVFYSAGGTTNFFRFIYAEGAKHLAS